MENMAAYKDGKQFKKQYVISRANEDGENPC